VVALGRRVILVLLCTALTDLPTPLQTRLTARGGQAAQAAGLKIVVVAGEDAVNIIQQKSAVAPIVEVRDRNDQPVAGVVVTFSIRGAQNATFGGGANALTLTTNAAGRAAVTGLTPTGTGAVQINVAAAFQGQTASATIVQTNFATAAQAASSAGTSGGSAGGSGGGGLGTGTITAITVGAVGAAGGLYALRKEDPASQPLSTGEISVDPAVAMQGTHVFFNTSGGSFSEAKFTWDFGDGMSSTVTNFPAVNHIYLTPGTFTVRLTATDSPGRSAQGQATVTIKSMTGRWTLDTRTGFIDFIQSGSSITGTFTVPSGQGSGAVTGTVGPGLVPGFENFAPGVDFTITPTGGGAQSRFIGSVRSDGTANLITGGLITGSSSTFTRLTRQ
jgi:hypothetical protein